MKKASLFFLSLLCCYQVQAQYTEIINSNRPGASQGGFAVGRKVVQLEIGGHFGKDEHALLNRNSDRYGVDFQLRYGILPQLEINWRGDFLSVQQQLMRGGVQESYEFSNFKSNALGLKYLIYDPYRAHYFDKPNLYSWKANHSFKWWKLIPAVAVYAGVNLNFGNQPIGYPFYGEGRPMFSPKLALITQHNWGPFVFVMNFIADRLTEEHKRYVGIFTLTGTISRRASLFIEYQSIKNDFYSDDLFRFGGAFLLTKDIQIDISGLVNFKDTPSRWQAGLGVSYRLDFHQQDVKLFDPDQQFKQTPKQPKRTPKQPKK